MIVLIFKVFKIIIKTIKMLKFNIVPHTYLVKKLLFLGNGNRNFGEKVASYFPGF